MTPKQIVLEVLDDAAISRRAMAAEVAAYGAHDRAEALNESAATCEEVAAGIRDGRLTITVAP